MKHILQELEERRGAPASAAARRASRRSMPAASSPRASASNCCSTPIRSRSSTCSSSIATPISAPTRTAYPGDGVVTGWGTINGRMVYVFAKDFTVFGGSLSETHAQKICKIQDMAMQNGAPVIGLLDAGGARIQEGVAALPAMARCSSATCLRAAWCRRFPSIMGPCAGGDVYSPAMTDFIFMVRDTSYMFITGPDVVKTVTQEDVTPEQLGGAKVHTTKSAVADGAFENDVIALEEIRRLLRFPAAQQSREAAATGRRPTIPRREELSLDTLVPENPNKPYDMKELILKVVDEGDFFEIRRSLRAQHHHRLRPPRRLDGGFRRQPADGAGGRARFRCQPQGGALRAVLRLLQHSDRHLRGRAGLSAGHRAGTWRHHQARRKLLFAYHRSHLTESDRHHAQGLWRRL